MSKVKQKTGYNIVRVVQSDKNCIKAMNVCSAMKREHLKEFISDNRIQKMTWDKVFDRREDPKTGEFIWTRGENFDKFVQKHSIEGCEFKGKASTNQDGSKHHDLAVANHYCFNMTQEERDTARTEAQQRYEITEYANYLLRSDIEDERDKGQAIIDGLKDNTISMCDIAYTSSEGIEIGFEITTEYYTPEMTQAKADYCEIAGLTFVAQEI